MKALSDDRVRYERAPFDHPELCVPDGHLPISTGSPTLQNNGNPAFTMSAADRWVGIPAVGRGGNTAPLQTFEELLAGIGADGTRAHNMSEACGIAELTAGGFVSANAASFERTVVAQDSIVAVFAKDLTAATGMSESNPAPTTLAGLTVSVEDSTGVTRNAPLFFVSPAQINFLVPEGTAPGPAAIAVKGGAAPFQSAFMIKRVSPGLFGANGFAAANVLTLTNGEFSSSNTLRAGAGGALELVPIDLGREDQKVFLVLYGTGIRHHMTAVTATIGSATVEAAYAGPQGTFGGQDQINVELPRALRGAGVVDVTLSVDGQTTNSVKISIQ
jgi:uncharacterized protein (TIGR03437 family)